MLLSSMKSLTKKKSTTSTFNQTNFFFKKGKLVSERSEFHSTVTATQPVTPAISNPNTIVSIVILGTTILNTVLMRQLGFVAPVVKLLNIVRIVFQKLSVLNVKGI